MDGDETQAVTYADGVRHSLGLPENATIRTVVQAAMGADCLRLLPMRRGDSALMRSGDQWQIVARKGIPSDRVAWVVAWQLSSWLLRQDGVTEDGMRRVRSRVAAELLMPRSVASRQAHKSDPVLTSERFKWPLAATLLRQAELLRIPTCLVLPSGYVRTRGDDGARLPTTADEVRAMAARARIGVKKYNLPDGLVLQLTA